jgi:hypothetical protein
MAEQVGDEHDGPPAPEYDLTLRVGDVVRSSADPVLSRWSKWRQPLAVALLLVLVAGVMVMILVGAR